MKDTERLYHERLKRYLTALRHGKPDKIPIRPFVAEFTAKHAGLTCQEVVHDYNLAFAAARRCATDFDWDAVVGNMVYVWTGLTQALGLKYYAIPGIDVPADTGFQYREPNEDAAFMRADEYDRLIDDPTAFLYEVWLPRVSTEILPPGAPVSYRNQLALVKGAIAMANYFNAFGVQNARLRSECGTVSAISGILKAPFDILADKFRGYIGLTMDMMERPGKVLAACEALMPHLLDIALGSADPLRQVPVGYWMHRGCIPFVSKGQFESHYWPTVKPIVEELWCQGHQTLFYAEGNWDAHLESFKELPDLSIVYHVDIGNILKVHRELGHKFCLSGGVPNYLLGYGTPAQVRMRCKQIIDAVAQDGGYIMDASAIIQNDAREENLRALTEFTREYGVYSGAADAAPDLPPPAGGAPRPKGCMPWELKAKDLPPGDGDPDLLRRIWEEVDSLGSMFVWQLLLSF